MAKKREAQEETAEVSHDIKMEKPKRESYEARMARRQRRIEGNIEKAKGGASVVETSGGETYVLIVLAEYMERILQRSNNHREIPSSLQVMKVAIERYKYKQAVVELFDTIQGMAQAVLPPQVLNSTRRLGNKTVRPFLDEPYHIALFREEIQKDEGVVNNFEEILQNQMTLEEQPPHEEK